MTADGYFEATEVIPRYDAYCHKCSPGMPLALFGSWDLAEDFLRWHWNDKHADQSGPPRSAPRAAVTINIRKEPPMATLLCQILRKLADASTRLSDAERGELNSMIDQLDIVDSTPDPVTAPALPASPAA